MLARVVSDLRERRLWPFALVLVVAIIAVPIVLAKSPPNLPTAPASIASLGTAELASLPGVRLSPTPPYSLLRARPRDPFAPPAASKTTTRKTASPKKTGGSGTGKSTTSSTTSQMSSSLPSASGTGSGSGNGPSPAPSGGRIPAGHASPAPTGLAPNQSYDVTLATTRPDGGLDTTAALERLSPVPSPGHPLLVELGVLQGGRRVLFAVMPGTQHSGPGSCTPGPVDCEVLALGVNQVETVSNQSASPPVQFAVTAVTVGEHGSAAAALRARRAVSAEGRWLVSGGTLIALSLFSYEPSLGAIVDLRDLSTGGN